MPFQESKPLDPILQEYKDRFWSKVKIGDKDKCWDWTGSVRGRMGYGCFGITKYGITKTFLAHRVSFYLTFGQPKDCVLHKCDRPICVSPHHLFEGSQYDNKMDMIKKGRNVLPIPPDMSGDKCHFAVLNWEKVREMRRKYSTLNISAESLGVEFECGRSTAQAVVNNESWYDPEYRPTRLGKRGAINPHRMIGAENKSTTITDDQVRQIRKLYDLGVKHSKIAEMVGVNETAITNIGKRRSRKYVK